jgi:hypothetical protein
MSYADIAGVVALFFTAFTFALSMWQWSKRRTAEQITIAKEIMDGVRTKFQQFIDIWQKRPEDKGSDHVKSEWIRDFKASEGFLEEIEYFTALVKQKSVEDKSLTGYYAVYISRTLGELQSLLKEYSKLLSRWSKPGLKWDDSVYYPRGVEGLNRLNDFLAFWSAKLPSRMRFQHE